MKTDSYRRQFFRLLVLYRWTSLIPPLLFLRASPENALVHPLGVLGAAVLGNLVITFWAAPLNDLLIRQPWTLAVDLVYCVGLLFLSGGGAGSYYMYSLSPLFAAAFFFQVRGGLFASAGYSLLFLGAHSLLTSGAPATTDLVAWITQLAGAWLVPAVVGALSSISRDLQAANQELLATKSELSGQNIEISEAHQQLQTIHDLTLLLQAAPDVRSMQEQVLATLSRSLHTPRALLGLVKPGTGILYAWRALKDSRYVAEPGIAAQMPLDLAAPDAPLLRTVLAGVTTKIIQEEERGLLHPEISAWLGGVPALAVPLIFHEQPVGVLIIPVSDQEAPGSTDRAYLIETLANQAATSLGTTMLCVERAQDLAVEQERNRIAREIHDTVSQSLFGMVYSLDACIRMLPANVDGVQEELIELQSLANQTREQVRHSIFDLWPSSLTLDIFKADLDQYVSHCFRLMPFEIHFDIEGDFNELSPALRRNLYRITQEALTNALHHAGVDEAWVRMVIEGDSVDLIVEDRGVGFDVQTALARDTNREHFGLHGIQERTQAMGGVCRIISQPDEGSRIQIQIPLRDGRGERSIRER